MTSPSIHRGFGVTFLSHGAGGCIVLENYEPDSHRVLVSLGPQIQCVSQFQVVGRIPKTFRKKQHFSRKAMTFLAGWDHLHFAWSSQSHCNLCGTMAMWKGLGCIAKPETVGTSKYDQNISNLSKLMLRVVRYFRYLIPKFGILNLGGLASILFFFFLSAKHGLWSPEHAVTSTASILCQMVGVCWNPGSPKFKEWDVQLLPYVTKVYKSMI